MSTDYRHHVPGRLRVRSSRIKQQALAAADAQSTLSVLAGVARVESNVLTGSVTIHYNPATITAEHLLHHLHSGGYIDGCELPQPPPPRIARTGSNPAARIMTSVASALAEKALERTLATLIAAAL